MKAVGLFVGRCDDVVERAGSDAIGKIDTTTCTRTTHVIVSLPPLHCIVRDVVVGMARF